MKHLFIINPAAGKRNQAVDYTKKIGAVMGPRGLDYEIRVSSHKGNCTELARAAAQTGEEVRIYACGGDGTLNEIVCGIAGFPNAAVTPFPGGSGNDFVRMFSQPEAFSDLERLLDAEEARMDLICVNGRTYALNICSMGIDARIGTEVSHYKRIPGVTGHGAYNISTVVNLLKGISRPAEVECGGKVYPGKKTLVCVCNGQYYGGGFNPVPDARPDDGLLDVLIIRDVSLLTAARVIGKYKHGEYALLPEYITHCRVPEITIRCEEESVINADGECLRAKEATFTVLPGALRFIYPRGLTYGKKQTEALFSGAK